jgi:large subunit ribosomal protein L29
MPGESMTEIDDEGLVQRLAEAKQELFNLRFQHVTGQLPSSTRLRETRKTIARIHTELRAREIAAADELATKETRS